LRIALSTDHAGFEQLQKLQEFLKSQGHVCVNFGPGFLDPNDDYPDFIRPCAEAVAAGKCEAGIIFGSSGQGEAMVANRIKGVRCGVFYGPAKALGAVDADGGMPADDYEILRLNRQHNHANMLSLAGRFMDQDMIEKAVTIWLETPYSDLERHLRRVRKIDEL
jgi:ribose 5-phosphate isomerase B